MIFRVYFIGNIALGERIFQISQYLVKSYLAVTFSLFLHVLNLLLLLGLFVYLRLIIGILSLCISAHLTVTVLLLLNPVLNLTYSLRLITSSHSHASASDSIFDIGAI